MSRSTVFHCIIAVVIMFSGTTPSTAQTPPTGTTVITHGYQATSSPPDWVYSMAAAVARRSGDGRIYVNNETTGGLDDCTHPLCGSQGAGGETIIIYDWADDSNESGTGFSESAGESLFAGLVQWSREDPPKVSLEHLHLIGHSRGTVVNSETAERLIAAGFPPPEQLTSLDPHDGGALKRGEDPPEPEQRLSWEDFDVNAEHPEYRCGDPPEDPSGICSWAGVGFCDDYWRDLDNWACNVDPDGKPIPGASVLDASDIDDFCHSDVHTWYAFTIDTAAPTDPVTGDPPGDDWFVSTNTTCDGSSRTVPLARTVAGFNMSRIGGGDVRCPDVPDQKQEVHFDFNLREGLVNGGFDNDGSGGTDIPGWSFHGGGGPAEVDTSDNPYLDLHGGEWREHNRFFLPADAAALDFCRRVFDPGTPDVFSLLLHIDDIYRTVYEEPLSAATDWQCFRLPLLPDERNRPVRLTAMLSDLSGAGAEVGVDDIFIVTGLFFDGFETGDTSRWSSASFH